MHKTLNNNKSKADYNISVSTLVISLFYATFVNDFEIKIASKS